MRAVFLSHSSADNGAAQSLATTLRGWGYESLFLDIDARNGIPGGADWKQELYTQLKRSAAIIPLYSQSFFTSRWCFAEVVAAGLLGKSVIGLRLDGTAIPADLASAQFIEFDADASAGFERLRRALEREDVTPSRDFAPDFARAPYPGLNAFDESDAAVFFGRDADIRAIVDRLNYLRAFGGKRCFMLIAGASGSGKSSLLRAGVLAGLRKQRDRWTVLTAFRPREGSGPLQELEHRLGHSCGTPDELLSGQSGPSTLVIGVDQFEELFAGDAPPDATAFARLLLALNNPARVIVIATIRSDLLGTFQTHPSLHGLDFELYALNLMPQPVFAELVEGPADVYGLRFDPPSLVNRIAAEAGTREALPLLAFALREMYDRAGTSRVLREADYDALEGIPGAVAKVARQRFEDLRLTPGGLDAVRVAFHRLVRFDANFRPTKVAAEWDTLPENSRPAIEALVNSRLLIEHSEGDRKTVEIAHESLFRVWPALAGWLKDDQRFLLWRQDLDAQRERWQRDQKDRDALLRGRALADSSQWLRTREAELDTGQLAYIRKSVSASRLERVVYAVVFVMLAASLSVAGVFFFKEREATAENAKLARLVKGENDAQVQLLKARALAPSRGEPKAPELGPNGRPARAAKQWNPGQTLHVRFLDGSPAIRSRIGILASQWMTYANINFVFDDASDADLRIGIEPPGSWAFIGTDASKLPTRSATVNLGFFAVPSVSDKDRDRAVLHEFGHVLGLVHEFQMPDATIQWNRSRMYEMYAQPPYQWNRETVDLNFFQKIPASMYPQKPFDPESIMMYPIPKDYTANGVGYPMTYDISEGDKAYISQLYPGRK